ncbi:MAG: InlB B-repeat-containing protein [Bacteroidales bacterium]|nr:InlB B-repeat-containing protein [Clostridium sp.]MCM1204228.1 InlB B-repeat-containing protein [Bacteroidales bacterium]
MKCRSKMGRIGMLAVLGVCLLFCMNRNALAAGTDGEVNLTGDTLLNLENPEAALSAVNGSTVSTGTAGKPKVLVFYKQGCGYCMAMLRELHDSSRTFSDVDILAVDILSTEIKDVEEYSNTYGRGDITFCSNAGYVSNKYLRVLGITGSFYTPLVVYINAENKIVRYTNGYVENFIEEIYRCLDTAPKTHKAVYRLNGGKQNENPAEFEEGKDYPLSAPVKKGYTFSGWYTDAAGKNKITNLDSCKEDVTLYARWKKVKYKITYVMRKGKNHKKNPKNYTVTTKTIILKKPARKGYVFKGWYRDKKYKQKITRIKKGSTGNLKLYAKWVRR